MTQGVSKDGTPLFPLMPYPHFGALDEEDIHAVLAYVRSFKAIENTPKPRQLNFPLNMIVRTIPAPNAFTKRPSPEDKLAYGKYMTKAALCTECHTPIDEQGTQLPGMEFAGGMEFLETGYRVRAANITPDANTGIGSWTEQQFIDKFKGFEKPTNVDARRARARAEHADADHGVRGHDARGPVRDLRLHADAEARHQSRRQISGREVRS